MTECKPLRVLQCVNIMDRAGLETMLMNYYREIDRDILQFDFLTHRSKQGAYDEEIRKLGGRVYHAPRLYPQNASAYHSFMRGFFRNHFYTIVHSHIDAMSLFPLASSRENEVPIRISHSHNDSVDHDLKLPAKQLFKHMLPSVATDYWACSKAAGMFLFGKKNVEKVHVLRNAIDLTEFQFNSSVRKMKRAELGIEDDVVVIGHVGRLCSVKNQALLIRLMTSLQHDRTKYELLIVGDGELRADLERDTQCRGLGDRVHFLGARDDVPELTQAFDVVVFPSLHEGIPLALIEAQASGLSIVSSDRVANEALILPNARKVHLNAPIAVWRDTVEMAVRAGRIPDASRVVGEAGYDIRLSAEHLVETYLSLAERGAA